MFYAHRYSKSNKKANCLESFFSEFCEYANDLSEELFVQKIEC